MPGKMRHAYAAIELSRSTGAVIAAMAASPAPADRTRLQNGLCLQSSSCGGVSYGDIKLSPRGSKKDRIVFKLAVRSGGYPKLVATV